MNSSPPPHKIKRLNDLVSTIQKLKKTGKKIVLCHGVFDLLHPGHIRHFISAKKYGDVLIVTLTADSFVKKGPGRPIFNQELRAEVLASIGAIDYVSIIESPSALSVIEKIQPDYYIKGPDYLNRKHNPKIPRKLDDEAKAVTEYGGQVIITDDDVIFSSSKLINDYLAVYPPRTKKYLETIKGKYSPEQIFEKLAQLSKLKVLIIGDAIIDQYHYCVPMGKSSKEPVMVHRYLSEESFLGGTLATANHMASLVNSITLMTILGKKDSFRNFIKENLKPQVAPVFFYQSNSHTIIKRRYLDKDIKQKLFQISYLKDEDIPVAIESQILKTLKRTLRKFDLVVVNDFGHGMLTPRIITLLSEKARFLALNVQANSANYGFNVITKYPRADYVCIDEQEIRLATHDKHSPLQELIKRIQVKMKCRDIMVTRGYNGTLIYAKRQGFYEASALTEQIVDRVGAGDALFAITSPCIYRDLDKDLVSFVGNVAGALQVQTVGNRKAIEYDDLHRFINRLLK